jgi:hypothetical protein
LAKWLVVAVFWCWSLAVQAAVVSDFYSATVPVPNREEESFRQGAREALVQVLVKVSAMPANEIRHSPAIAADLAQGDKLTVHFSYVVRKEAFANGKAVDRLYLKAGFGEKTITSLLQKGNFRIWPNERPQVLIWPVVKGGKASRVLSLSSPQDASLVLMISDAAQNHGLPWAIGESSRPENADYLWRWDEPAIDQLSRRYGKEAVLVFRMATLSGNQAVGGWLLVSGGKSESVDIPATSVQEFLRLGMAWAASRLASRQVVSAEVAESGELLLAVHGVDSEAKFQSLAGYLESLGMVGRVFLRTAEKGQLQFSLVLKGDLSLLEKALAAGGRLARQEGSGTSLVYNWIE